MPNFDIKNQKIPKSPWIYKFLNSKNEIIYIWKSVNLKSRVFSYFNWKSKLNFAKQKMVDQIENLEYIITNNEQESLILENTLIKKHKPKYNILLKDDKNFNYIKITSDPIPKVFKTRFKTKDWEYFWPYPNWSYVFNLLKFFKKYFKIRSCDLKFEKNSENFSFKKSWNIKIPCMDYYIWLCSWPCLLEKKNIDEYLNNIDSVKKLLKWDNKKLLSELEQKMKNFAKDLKFEQAKQMKDFIDAIFSLESRQTVRDFIEWDCDVVSFIEKYDKNFIWVLKIRESKLVWYKNFEVENNLEENREKILWYFLENFYLENSKKLRVLSVFEPEIENEILKTLKINLEVPKIWDKMHLLDLSTKNLFDFAYKQEMKNISKKFLTKSVQQNILEKLNLENLGKKDLIFECYDISHISWSHTVASRSVITNWKTDSQKYKKYRLKTIENKEIDDFKSMFEIMTRRWKEILEKKNNPDLIIIDWWKWQLSSSVSALEKILWKWNLPNICSIAKREEEVFLPGNSEPVILEHWSKELMLVQKIRDESHRFAITFNRDSRIKSMKKNILEDLPGFWPKTRQKLLKNFWSVEKIFSESEKNLENFLTKKQILTLKNNWLIK